MTIKRFNGVRLKTKDFYGILKKKVNVMAIWGVYTEAESLDEPDKKDTDIDESEDTDDPRGPEFICDHEIDDTGYTTVYRVKKNTIRWNDEEGDEDGKPMDDLEFVWDSALKVYLSTNDSDKYEQMWFRVLKTIEK